MKTPIILATIASIMTMASSAYAEDCAIMVDGKCLTTEELESSLAFQLQKFEFYASRFANGGFPYYEFQHSQNCTDHAANYNTYLTQEIRVKYVNWPESVDPDRCLGPREE